MSQFNEQIEEQIEELVEGTRRTIRDLVTEAQSRSVTAASSYVITLPSGETINIISGADHRLNDFAPVGTIISPRAAAKAG